MKLETILIISTVLSWVFIGLLYAWCAGAHGLIKEMTRLDSELINVLVSSGIIKVSSAPPGPGKTFCPSCGSNICECKEPKPCL